MIAYFALEVPASRAANVMNINHHSAERVYQVIRSCLARECELRSPLGGEIECDESYFGGRRKGLRSRGAASKVPVFGLLKRHGKGYTRIVEDVSRKDLAPIIKTKVVPESVIAPIAFAHMTGWCSTASNTTASTIRSALR